MHLGSSKMGAKDIDIPARYVHIFMSVVQRVSIAHRYAYIRCLKAAAAAAMSIGSQGCIVCSNSDMPDGHVDVFLEYIHYP